MQPVYLFSFHTKKELLNRNPIIAKIMIIKILFTNLFKYKIFPIDNTVKLEHITMRITGSCPIHLAIPIFLS